MKVLRGKQTIRSFCIWRRIAILSVLLSVALVGTFSPVSAQDLPATASLIVKMVSGLTPQEQSAVISANGGTETSSTPVLRLHVVEVQADQVSTIMQNYQLDPRVENVEMNKTREVQGIPSDPQYGTQWALPHIGWDLVCGTIIPVQSTKVAVLDTGVQATHKDLLKSVVKGTSFIDGSTGLTDTNGHGTWLAGIIAAVTDNNFGIAGVGCNKVKIVPVKVMGADGTGQDSDIINGVIWAADNGADVILMGFSNPGFSPYLQEAIDYAWSKGVVLVAATGNIGISDPTFPAGDRGVIGVSATDQSDNLAFFSNYGLSVFLAGPGVDILTTGLKNSLVSISGTSASAAIVAGVAAFMKADDPTLTNGVIVGRLARTADPAGTQEETGNGRVNMARALEDTSFDEIQPAGAEPVGEGGPYVGPYEVAACTLTSVTVSAQIGTVTYGTGGSVTYTITLVKSNANCSGTFSIITTLPTGVTATFNPTGFSGSGTTKTSTLTLTTSNSTPVGANLFTV